jgi:large subunit ribosomal protein L4
MPVFSMDGKKLSTVVLPEEIFGASWRADLVHQVTTAMQANARQNRAHTKDRAEVSRGKKPWKQKGHWSSARRLFADHLSGVTAV